MRLTAVAAAATLLSSIGLYPLYDSAKWVVPGFGAVLAAAAAGLLARRFRLPVPVDIVAGLVTMLLYVTVVYTPAEALLGIIPTPASLNGLNELLDEGWQVANKYAAPVPLGPGVELMGTLGIGLVAVLVDFLVVRLRRAAAAGLPLLAMYSVPAAVREESVSWVAFLLGAVGFMGLLLADSSEQVNGWGRPVFTRRWSAAAPREQPGAAALAATGYRVGLTAVAIAVLLPTVIPGIHPRGMFGMGGAGRGGGSGSATVTTLDPLVSLKRELARQDDAVVLTYRTNATERPDYLRMYALDRFDGDRWTYTPLRNGVTNPIDGGALPAAAGLSFAPTQPVNTRIRIERRVRDMTFLPMPYPPVQIAVEGDWRVDPRSLMVYSLRDAAGGRTYSVDSLRVQPTQAQLATASDRAPADITVRYLDIPRQVPESVRRLAMDQTADAPSLYEKAVALQAWFTRSGEFTYDLSKQSPKHVSDLVDFLTRSKRGYCEQFAASMALLARTLGIPARVAMGYTAGTQATDGSWIVRSRDAHAWPELYFEGAGWVRFEPTPSGVVGQGTASVPPYSEPASASEAPAPGAEATPTPSESAGAAGASPGATPGARPDDPDLAGGAELPQESGGWWLSPAWIAVVALIVLIMMAPMTLATLNRRRRWRRAGYTLVLGHARPGEASERPPPGRDEPVPQQARDRANAAWTQLRTDAIDHRLPWRTNESPRATSRRLAEHLRLDAEAEGALGRIALAEERARYAPVPADVESLRADSRLVREAFARSVSWLTRWRARLVPPSALIGFRQAAGRALDAIELLVTRLSRPPRRRG
ncbi:DUF3488 and transglutaminase-like domain-containing protein [Actinomadura alba]